MNYQEIAQKNQERAWRIIKDTEIIKLWEDIGAEVNLVGSLKTGLLMKNRDIDFHVYTTELNISTSFTVMEKLAHHPCIKEIQYRNLIETDEECIEWHAWYEDEETNRWQIDIIHILKGSMYDGVVEGATKAILNKMTPEIKKIILKIKFDVPDGIKVPAIQIYYAVIECKVYSYNDFIIWRKQNKIGFLLGWKPKL